MKIRLGFISNSSSASYTLYLRGDHPSLYKLICQKLEIFQMRSLMQEQKRVMKYLASAIAREKKKKPEIFDWDNATYWQNKLHALNTIISSFSRLSDQEKVHQILIYHQYIVCVSSLGDLGVSGWVSMWNGDEDLSPTVQSLKKLAEKHKIPFMLNVSSD